MVYNGFKSVASHLATPMADLSRLGEQDPVDFYFLGQRGKL